MTKKRVVLLIVEGASDERVLATITQELNDQNSDIQVDLVHGDAFTRRGTSQGKTIIKKVMTEFVTRTKIPPKQIVFVGYLVDVDGTYLPVEASRCLPKLANDYFQYVPHDENVIFGSKGKLKNVQEIWQRKRRRLDQLQALNFSVRMRAHSGTSSQVEIPVQLYFNNVTLEHVLVKKLLRGPEFEAEKRRIVRGFSHQLLACPSPFDCAKNFFAQSNYQVVQLIIRRVGITLRPTRGNPVVRFSFY